MSTQKILLANALSMRKEFETRVTKASQLDISALRQRIEERISTGADRSSLDAKVTTLSPFEAVAAPMFEILRLRKLDDVIQATNVKTTIEVPKSVSGLPMNKESGVEQMTLHRALLLRKEYDGRRKGFQAILDNPIVFQEQFTRTSVASKDADPKDHAVLVAPRLKKEEMQSAFDWTAMQFRLLNDVISKTNWSTEIEVDDIVLTDFSTIQATGRLAHVIGSVANKKEAQAAS